MDSQTGAARIPSGQARCVEWPTLLLLIGCWSLWGLAVILISPVFPWLGSGILVLTLVLHASLTHEVCHGHPLPSRWMSEALVYLNPGLAIPYLRFRDTHLAHHQDAILTDPYDDPESNYLDPASWRKMPAWLRAVRRINNTLGGRILIGPALGQWAFMAGDIRAIRAGDGQVLKGWLLHGPFLGIMLVAVALSPMSIWAYLLCCYAALSVLKIRTFLEHQAHERARCRTVIIEDRGLLSFLFLNNNLHVVHHMHPRVPWYRLPALYEENKARYLACNESYLYHSYREIFARYLWRTKDPVAHPLWSSERK